MKKTISLLLMIFLSVSVFAVHESIPDVNWENSDLNNLKKEDLCSCWSFMDQVKKYRNPELDAVFTAKQCVNACYHCNQKTVNRPIERCLTSCLSSGGLKTEKQLINCMNQCPSQYCTNEIKLELEKKIVPIIVAPKTEPEPVKKEEPKEEVITKEPPKEVEIVDEEIKIEEAQSVIIKEVLTLEECNNLAVQAKKETFCEEDLTLSNFIMEINPLIPANKDSSSCTTEWKDHYSLEKQKCRAGIINSLKEKGLLLPIILIILAVSVMILAIFYYFHRKKWHPIDFQELPEPIKEEEIKTEITIEIPKELNNKKTIIKNKPKSSPFVRNSDFLKRP